MTIHLLVFVAPQIDPAAGERSTGREFETLWADLATSDAIVAQRTITALVARGVDTVAFLGKQLRPVCHPGTACLAGLIADLDRNEFSVRERATLELERLGPLAESALRQALTSEHSLEVGRRIERVLQTHKNQRLHPPPDHARLARAVEVLEQIGSSPARRILEKCVQGAPEAPLTRDAKGALDRLAGKSTNSP